MSHGKTFTIKHEKLTMKYPKNGGKRERRCCEERGGGCWKVSMSPSARQVVSGTEEAQGNVPKSERKHERSGRNFEKEERG